MKYYIIGNGGFSKEILILSKEVFGSTSDFLGFLDVNPKKLEVKIGKYLFPVYDEEIILSNLNIKCNVFIGIADPAKISNIKKKYARFSFPNLIHPSVLLDKDYVALGQGNIISS